LAQKYEIPETAIRMTTQQLPANPSMAAALGTEVTQQSVDAVNATTGKGTVDNAPANTSEGATPDAPVEQVNNSADLITVNFAEDSYVPNDRMAANARRALDVRASKPPSQRGMTSVGLARARDIQNKKPLSADTVRRMKAYFDRHEIDKQGSTWDEQGKGWQAWNGWGGDAGQTWANAIVERLNKQRTENSAEQPQRVELAARIEVEKALVPEMKPNAAQWLDAIIEYRRRFDAKANEAVKAVTEGKTLIELSQSKKFDLPTPNAGETHDDFMARCMADPVATAEFPDAEQRTAVCMRQHEGQFAKVGERGAIVGSDKAPKSDTPNRNPEGEGSAKGDASGKSAEVTAEQEATLQQKADDFNAKESNTRYGRATLGQLKSVFQRGLGAFNTSHSPRVQSASQWAFARVNAFLYLLKNGRPENPNYTTDNDLLPSKHPKSGK